MDLSNTELPFLNLGLHMNGGQFDVSINKWKRVLKVFEDQGLSLSLTDSMNVFLHWCSLKFIFEDYRSTFLIHSYPPFRLFFSLIGSFIIKMLSCCTTEWQQLDTQQLCLPPLEIMKLFGQIQKGLWFQSSYLVIKNPCILLR
jgi:hypothetical protein